MVDFDGAGRVLEVLDIDGATLSNLGVRDTETGPVSAELENKFSNK